VRFIGVGVAGPCPTVPESGMARITQHSLELLRSRVNIVDEVERHVRLTKAGRSYKGLSPFTQEKTPSFYVNPDKGAFYCFSSTQGGDVIRFVEMVEHLPFGEAVEALAQRYNVALEYEDGSGTNKLERSQRTEQLEIHERTCAYYHRAFMGQDPLAEQVRDYWTQKRRFTMEVAQQFMIGFDPPVSDALIKELLAAGHSPTALMESGIFTGPEGNADVRRMRSRFRGRLTIPIREPSQGQVIAFTARELFCTPGAEDKNFKLSKYVNSPGTVLFHKSNVLFNLDRAQKAVRDDPAGFIMVEGQLDSIRCFTSGFGSVVAPQGTSVTDEQMLIMKRHSDRLRVVLDGDAAGQRAALRALPMALAAGLEPSFVVLPPGDDPDSMILGRGPEAFRSALDGAIPAMTFVANSLRADPEYSGPRGLAEAMKRVYEIISKADNEVVRIEYLSQVCRLMRVDFDAARRDMSRFMLRQHSRMSSAVELQEDGERNSSPRLTTLERDLWYLILQNEDLIKRLSEIVDEKWIDEDIAEGRLLGRLFWEFRDGTVDSVAAFIDAIETPDERNLVFSMQAISVTMLVEEPKRQADNLLQRLFVRYRKKRIAQIDAVLANATTGQNVENLLEERNKLLLTVKKPPILTVCT
jgi:DNA primase